MKLFSWIVLAAAAAAGWWWWRKRHGPTLAPPAAAAAAPVSTAAVVSTLLADTKSPTEVPRVGAPPSMPCPAGKVWTQVSQYLPGKPASYKWTCKATTPLPPVGYGVTAPAAIVNGIKSGALSEPETLSAPKLKAAPSSAPAGAVSSPLPPPVTVRVGLMNISIPASAFGRVNP